MPPSRKKQVAPVTGSKGLPRGLEVGDRGVGFGVAWGGGDGELPVEAFGFAFALRVLGTVGEFVDERSELGNEFVVLIPFQLERFENSKAIGALGRENLRDRFFQKGDVAFAEDFAFGAEAERGFDEEVKASAGVAFDEADLGEGAEVAFGGDFGELVCFRNFGGSEFLEEEGREIGKVGWVVIEEGVLLGGEGGVFGL